MNRVSILDVLNIAIAATGFVCCLYSVLQAGIAKNMSQNVRKVSISIFGSLFCFDFFDTLGTVFDGHPGMLMRSILIIADFCDFVFGSVLIYFAAKLIRFHVGGKWDSDRRVMIVRGCMIGQIIMLIINLFAGFIYVIDENNVYQRCTLYPLLYVFPLIMLILCFSLRITNRYALNKKQRLAFDGCFALLWITMPMQMLGLGINFNMLGAILTTTTLYILMLEDQSEQYEARVQESILMRTNLLAGQLQPHFLSNAIIMIRALVEPETEAYEALDRLSRFIRGTLRVMTDKAPIPLDEELDIVEDYIDIQKIRFRDSIQVEWDIQDSDFKVPILSVQIPVENAILHGIRENPGGKGTISIETEKHKNKHIVRISDDGMGFEPDQTAFGTGLENIRERLKAMCGGEVRVRSRIGEGTVVTLEIPDKEGESA